MQDAVDRIIAAVHWVGFFLLCGLLAAFTAVCR